MLVFIKSSGFHKPLSLNNMSYRHHAWNTVALNSSSPTSPSGSRPPLAAPNTRFLQPSFSSPSSSSTSYRRMSRGYASEIIPRLYISDLSFAENPSLLASHRITHIVSALPDSISIPPPSVLPSQPVRMQVKVEDFPFAELAAHLPHTTKFIRDALKRDPEARVLVHCAEGISRSVSVVAAFLMYLYGWSPTEALGYIKEKRPVANPNFGFVQQLSEYGRDALGQRLETPRGPS